MADTRLTVVQVLPALSGGGVERGTLEIAAALADAGHRSVVVSAGGRLVRQLEVEGSEHCELAVGRKSLSVLARVLPLRRLLTGLGADIVHARSRLPAWIARFALHGMPAGNRPHFLTTVHGLYSVGRYSAVMTSGERVIAVSECIRRYVLDNYPAVDPTRIVVIPRGVEASQWPRGYQPSPAWQQRFLSEHPQCAGKRLVTIAARLTRLKGHEDFLALMAGLTANGLPVHGLVVGAARSSRDAYATALHERVQRESLPVSFLGPRDDMRDLYAASSVVVSMSTRPESFGRSVLEALCLGVPVIGYEHGGVAEILAAMLPAGAVPVRDVEAATGRMSEWLRDGAPIPADNAFPLTAMRSATLALYADVLGVAGAD